MRLRALFTASVTVVGVAVAALTAGTASGAAPPRTAATTVSTQPSAFTAVTPCRLLDTRANAPARTCAGGLTRTGAFVRGATRAPAIAAAGRAVPAGATAVVLNVTLVNATGPTYLTVYPDGQPRPNSSSVNTAVPTAVPNLVTVALGSAGGVGSVQLYNSGSTVDVVIDLQGYYQPGAGAGYTPVTPCRAFDTRGSRLTLCPGARTTPTTRIGPNGDLTETLAGVGGIPADATAVTLNVTAVNASQPSVVTVYPAGQALPLASNLNVSSAAAVPNLVTVALGSGGAITLHNQSGRIDLLADVAGYYRAGAGAAFVPVTPCRIYDTRLGRGGCQPGWGQDAGGALKAGNYIPMPLPGLIAGIPVGAKAVALNVTAVNASRSTVVSVFADDVKALPGVSNLNPPDARPVANQVVVALPAGTPVPGAVTNPAGKVDLYNFGGQVDLVVDLAGYFV